MQVLKYFREQNKYYLFTLTSNKLMINNKYAVTFITTIHEKKKKLLLWQFTSPLRETVSMTNHSNDFFSRITRIGLAAVFSFVKWVMSVSWDETIGNRFVARNKGKFFSFICPSRNTPNRDETPRQIEIVPIRTRASLSLGTIGDTKYFFFASRNRSSRLDQN